MHVYQCVWDRTEFALFCEHMVCGVNCASSFILRLIFLPIGGVVFLGVYEITERLGGNEAEWGCC